MKHNQHQAQNDMLIAIYEAIANDHAPDGRSASNHELVDTLAAILDVHSKRTRTDGHKLPTNHAS
jgi:hypothetical protein